jgi:hypothetical protein
VRDPNAAKKFIQPNRPKPLAPNKNFAKDEFKELWKRINHKAAYTVEFASDELIKKAIEAAKEAAKEKKWNGKMPPNLKMPIHDGDIDRPDDENYAGHFFFNATSKDAPQIVDRKVQPILDPMECGSGDYCNVSVNFFGFAASGNKGIAAGLQNIQLVRHGERLAGKPSAASDFSEIEGEEEIDISAEDDMDFLN